MKKIKEKVKIGKTEFTVLFDTFPSQFSDKETENLKNDIHRNGICLPIIIDEDNNILDGARRARICSELMIKKDIPFIVIPNLTEQEKEEIHLTLNSNRKVISKDNKKEIAVVLRKKKYSLRRIAEVLNIGHETVRRWLNVSGETEECPDTVVGKDGVERPAQRPTTKILIKSVDEASKSSVRMQESEYTKDLAHKIIHAGHLDRELNKARQKNPPEIESPKTVIGKSQLFLGDFREETKVIADNSVDIVFTDPPYRESDLILYEGLAEVAFRVLKPGGLLLSYCGNMYIPQIHQMLGEKLEYIWTCAIRHTRGNTMIENTRVFQAYKPIVCYQKSPRNCYWTPFVDMTSAGKSKNFHEWEQPEKEAEYFLEHLAPKEGATMLDCMMGPGSFIVAGHRLGMKCYGIDIDASAYATALDRVNNEEKKNAA